MHCSHPGSTTCSNTWIEKGGSLTDFGSLLNSAFKLGDASHKALRFVVDDHLVQASVPGDSVFFSIKDILFNREYEYFPSFGTSSPKGIVIDAGAHAGLYTLISSFWAKKVIALEPDSKIFSLLEANIKSNGCDNVVLFNSALWTKNEKARFYQRGNSQLGALAKRKSTIPVMVDTISLETLIEKVLPPGSEGVDLLKLDIEGAEFDVISASDLSTLLKIKRLVAEVHTEHGTLPKLTSKLKECGFCYVVLKRPFKKPGIQLIRLIGDYKIRLTLGVTNLVSSLFLYADWSSLILFASRNKDDFLVPSLLSLRSNVIDSSLE